MLTAVFSVRFFGKLNQKGWRSDTSAGSWARQVNCISSFAVLSRLDDNKCESEAPLRHPEVGNDIQGSFLDGLRLG